MYHWSPVDEEEEPGKDSRVDDERTDLVVYTGVLGYEAQGRLQAEGEVREIDFAAKRPRDRNIEVPTTETNSNSSYAKFGISRGTQRTRLSRGPTLRIRTAA